MTEAQRKAISELRALGYAVVVFYPAELQAGNVSASTMESALVEAGNALLPDVE